jgi:RelA/SpoT family (p)ppGpp synthetase
MGYKQEILDAIKKNDLNVDIDKILLSYEFSKECHIGQYRKSGDEYIIHPIEVCKILINMKMDTDTIVAGILHDIVEDTLITVSDIEYNFGSSVAKLVDGVTKLSVLPEGTKKQHENIRKMIVAMAQDIRVVIIKLADRLHNMRTLKFMPDYKQERISRETLEIFAPLAHRLGMSMMKCELEDLSLYYLEPKIYRELVKLVDSKKAEREKYAETTINEIKKFLNESEIKGEVSGRAKHFYSIYKKMYEKDKEFDEIYDLIALRIIVGTEGECYNALGILHGNYKPVPGRFKDYIAVPKSNGYQSIHTTILGPYGKFIEVQIRTQEMHDIAEEGVAAHWSYKERGKVTKKDKVYSWLRQILEWQQEADNSEEFVKTVTGDILQETVFVFSPKGDVVELSMGATPLDFAFHIHTEVGLKCVGAKINDKIVPINTKLKNGDKIDIITSKNARGPGNDWLDIVVTQGAKSKIRKWIKDQKFEENAKLGKEIIEKELSKYGVSIKDFESSEITTKYIEKQNIYTIEDLYFRASQSRAKAEALAARFKPEVVKEISVNDIVEKKKPKSRKKNDYGVVIDGLDNAMIRFAKCCTPLPGDEIGGYITKGAGIAVHRSDCKNYQTMIKNDPMREIEVNWDEDVLVQKLNKYQFNFNVYVIERPNMLMDIATIIANHKINVIGVNSNLIVKGLDRYMNLKFTIEISEKEEYEKLLKHLSGIKDIIEIQR